MNGPSGRLAGTRADQPAGKRRSVGLVDVEPAAEVRHDLAAEAVVHDGPTFGVSVCVVMLSVERVTRGVAKNGIVVISSP